MEINFVLGKMEVIGSVVEVVGRLLWSGRETKCLQFTKFLKFDNFNSKACLGCLNRFMVPITLYQYINGHYLKETFFVKAVFQTQEAICSMSIPTIKYILYYHT